MFVPTSRRLALGGLTAAVLLVATTGCQLFRDFDDVEPSAPRCSVGEVVSCPCPGARSGTQRCTEGGEFGDCRCGGDTRDGSDGETDVWAGDTLDRGDADDGTDGDAASVSCPTGAGGAVVSRASSAPTIDADCSDAVYRGSTFTFSPPGASDGTHNGTDANQGTCHLAWKSGSPARVYGCCEIQDDVAMATTAPSDPINYIWGEDPNGSNDPVSPDDRVEYHVRNDLDSSEGPDDAKYYLNNAVSPGPATFAHSFDSSGDADFSYSPFDDAAASRSNGDWRVEWSAELPFEPSSGEKALCEIFVFDVDEGDHAGHMCSFSRDGNLDSRSDWGCCLYE